MRLLELFENEETVRWVVPPRMKVYISNGTEKVVWVDVSKIDVAWKLDRNFYVGPNGTEHAIKGRYERFDNWIKGGEAVAMSEMSLGYRDLPSFTNGRHRFAWMRDHGAQAIPVVTPVEGSDKFEEMYGSAMRKTTIKVA